ncbi:MAG TPA: M50 family metallopeptidase [Rhabdochlamydiaceae bacterium]|nr:M50 family metallopeptidase [Rhabdochlamydiaceae bacterium]
MPLQINTSQITEACSFAFNFTQSLLYGKSGTYKIGTISVEFKKRGPIINGVYKTLKNTTELILEIAMLRFCYTFVHEMGHAIAAKMLTGKSSFVTISHLRSSRCRRPEPCSDRDKKIILAAGLLASALFTCTQVFLTAMLFSSFPLIVRVIYFGAAANSLYEYWYLLSSVLSNNKDWGKLRKIDPKSFFLTASAVTVLYALCLHSIFKR